MDSKFKPDRYLIAQKTFALGKTLYNIYDESGHELLYVDQPQLFQMKLHLVIYSDETKSKKLLSIKKDKLFQFQPCYSVYDENDIMIGKIGKMFAAMRSSWFIKDGFGQELAKVKEDASSVFWGGLRKTKREYSNYTYYIGD